MPIINTIITLERLGLLFCGCRDNSKYHPKVGEYSTGGVGNFVEFLQFRVLGGEKVLEQHLKYFYHRMIWLVVVGNLERQKEKDKRESIFFNISRKGFCLF